VVFYATFMLLAGVGVGNIINIIRDGAWNWWWLLAFLGAAAVYFLYDKSSQFDWEEWHDAHPPRPRRQRGPNGQQFAIVGNGDDRAPAAGQGNVIAGVVGNHGWLIAGILLAIATLWYGMYNHSTGNDWTILVLLFAATAAAFLASAGVLKSFLRETLTNHFAKAWLFVSLVVAILLWKYAHDDGFTFGEMPQVWIALASAGVAGLQSIGQLVPLLKKTGEIVGKAYGFGYHPFLSLALIGGTLLFGYAFITKGAFNLFDDFEISQGVYDILKLAGAVGFFLIIFSPIVFKKK
jgi:hypothetical protein